MERLFELLERLVKEVEELKQFTKPFTRDRQERFELWQNKVRRILAQIYGQESEVVRKFADIDFSSSYWTEGMGAKQETESYQSGLTSARAFLRSLLETDGRGMISTRPSKPGRAASPTSKCFVSASFDTDARSVVEWFCDLAEAVGFEVDWLREFAELRPIEEKVKEHLRASSCLIQVLTRDVQAGGKERGWLGNEIAWSDEIHGSGKQALFVELGMKPSGIGPEITEAVTFDRERLHEVAPKAVDYLLKLLANVQATLHEP